MGKEISNLATLVRRKRIMRPSGHIQTVCTANCGMFFNVVRIYDTQYKAVLYFGKEVRRTRIFPPDAKAFFGQISNETDLSVSKFLGVQKIRHYC